MIKMRPPKVSADQIQPFTPEQVGSLLEAARTTRDYAVVLFMLDTGARASEVCSLRVPDVDLTGRKVKVAGKGGKSRTLFLSLPVTQALTDYLRTRRDGPLFLAERGKGVKAGRSLTRYGLQKLIQSLGMAAGVVGVRCSPHTLRHTFAVEFIRGGGNSFALKELLGHSSLDMTNRYVALALADLENQHRNYSPASRLLTMRQAQ
jgi:integrase/recombinase XerC/integrase/recombinase XerD